MLGVVIVPVSPPCSSFVGVVERVDEVLDGGGGFEVNTDAKGDVGRLSTGSSARKCSFS